MVKQAVARVDYLDEAPPRVAKAVVESYIDGLEYSHGMQPISKPLDTSS